uniref:Uncharacterized protein n=1 Tax=Anguilla anguilla TaxID=7936 RepID=A0A0E9WP91_ANGAN
MYTVASAVMVAGFNLTGVTDKGKAVLHHTQEVTFVIFISRPSYGIPSLMC